MRLVAAKGAALLGAAFLSLAPPARAQSTSTPILLPGESVARVQASATAKRAPDKLVLSTRIVSNASTARAAKAQNAVKLGKLVAALGKFGIPSGQIKTEELFAQAIHPEVNGNEDRSRIVGYRSTQRVTFDLRDFSRIEALFDELAALGVTDSSGATFVLTDRTPVEREAQRLAIAEARAEAENIAAALGKRVARLLLVANGPDTYRGDAGGSEVIVTGARARLLALDPAPVGIRSTVYADWSLVDR